MPFPFLGDSTRIYTQYVAADGTPLTALPGGAYDMTAVPSPWTLPVPPGDGLWGPAITPPPPPLPPVLTSANAETEEN